MYLTALILNLVDCESMSSDGLFKYSMIGLLQSEASIAITLDSSVVLG